MSAPSVSPSYSGHTVFQKGLSLECCVHPYSQTLQTVVEQSNPVEMQAILPERLASLHTEADMDSVLEDLVRSHEMYNCHVGLTEGRMAVADASFKQQQWSKAQHWKGYTTLLTLDSNVSATQ